MRDQGNNPPPPLRLYCNRKPRGKPVGFQSFRMQVFEIMGDRHFYRIECLHMLGTPESERLKVTALNLFHPTGPPSFQEVGILILRHSLLSKGEVACLPVGRGGFEIGLQCEERK